MAMAEMPHEPRGVRDLPDYEIVHTDADSLDDVKSRRSARPWLMAALLLFAAGGVAWFVVFRGPNIAQDVRPAQTSTAQPHDVPLPPLGGSPSPVNIPPLDQSDTVVRELVRQLTTHPLVTAWLTTDGLIRNFMVVTANIADGATPERHLRRLRPAEPFAVTGQGGQLSIDAASYRRYDKVAGAAASIDPAGAARLYATVKPRLEEAYRDLGQPDGQVDRALEQAIVRLLRTPIVERPPRVVPDTRGIGYVFADPELESLSAAQKQLVRMGPENTRTIQQSLRAIAIALGIPQARLPQPTVIDAES
jgi:hypothetical protein